MLKIVHFGKYYYPESGGIENATVSLAEGAALIGHEPSVVCFSSSGSMVTETRNGVKIFRLPATHKIFSQPLSLNYVLRCLSVAKSAHIVHLHAPNMLAAIAALLLPPNIKILVHWHSDIVGKASIAWLFRPIEFALLRRANLVIATSQAYFGASPILGYFNSKVSVIPLGVPDIKCSLENSPISSELDRKIRGRKIILAVGRFVRYKGFEYLVRAAAKLVEDSVVVIVGSGPMELELKELAASCNVVDRIVFTGRLEEGALHELFARASLYCMTSINRAEAFGIVLLEAMSHGLPVVASDIPGSGVPWVNQDGLTGFNVSVRSPDAIANACNLIISSEELRIMFSRNSRARFCAEFNEPLAVSRVNSKYECLLNA
jgi:glycosyltransferase involved in cell wall biosynthesis